MFVKMELSPTIICYLWAETHFCEQGDQNPGFTFDTDVNTMIHHYIPAERRRMRLDRLLCSPGVCLTPAAPVRLWGDEAVDVRREVFLSDHFGLAADLAYGEGLRGDDSVRELLRRNGGQEMEGSGSSTIRFVGALGYHIPWLAVRAAGWW